MPINERLAIRQARAVPILDKMKIRFDKALAQEPPKATFGEALHYLANEWLRLIHYVGGGRLPISNNPCEYAIKPIAIDRTIGCSHRTKPALVRVLTSTG